MRYVVRESTRIRRTPLWEFVAVSVRGLREESAHRPENPHHNDGLEIADVSAPASARNAATEHTAVVVEV